MHLFGIAVVAVLKHTRNIQPNKYQNMYQPENNIEVPFVFTRELIFFLFFFVSFSDTRWQLDTTRYRLQ